jgi:predicted transcriptional regulator
MLPTMLEHDRKQAGWSVGQAAWQLGVSVREYRELEAGKRSPSFETVGPDLQAIRRPQTFIGSRY